LGRRQKSGFQESYSATAIRIKVLQKLLDLNFEITCMASPLYEELLKRHEKAEPDCHGPMCEEPCHLICNYLNSDDVMNYLECNRRTALDYLQALKDIHIEYSDYPTGILRSRIKEPHPRR
jgi:hypothetical protein